jgi:hypothetical protein
MRKTGRVAREHDSAAQGASASSIAALNFSVFAISSFDFGAEMWYDRRSTR